MTEITFSELSLHNQIHRAIRSKGYDVPTPIQQKAIPPLLEGRDLIGVAQTGTGKTAAFALPILQTLAAGPKARRPGAPRTLVLTPTRELATQIGDSFAAYGQHLGLRHTVIFGGVGQGRQVAVLEGGIDILVATPGRLLDLIGQGYIDLGYVEIFVLDEADRMLDMGFIHDVRKRDRPGPYRSQRQTLMLFSATMPRSTFETLSDRHA